MALHNVLAGLAAGTAMDLVDAPNATAITAITDGLAVATELAKVLEDTGTTLDALIKDVPTNAEFAAVAGAPANTGGTATLAAILGDPLNVSLAARLIAIAAEVTEVEKHFHTRARWFGKLASQTGTDWADNTLSPYRVISGDNVYGADANDEALVFGTADIVITGQTKYDADSIMVVASSATTPWKIRFIYGTGTMADAITAGQFSETIVQVISVSSRLAKENFRMPRLTIGTDKLWAQGWNASDNATLDFLVGIHGYTA
jgi:hypothetical protein